MFFPFHRAHVTFRSCALCANSVISWCHRPCPGGFVSILMRVHTWLDLTELPPSPPPSCDHRCGQGDSGKTFTFEAPLTFDLSDIGPAWHTAQLRRASISRYNSKALDTADFTVYGTNCSPAAALDATPLWARRFRLGLGLGLGYVMAWRDGAAACAVIHL